VSSDGEHWSPNEKLNPNQKSMATPALSEGLMIHLGDELHRIWASTWDGERWLDNQLVLDKILNEDGLTLLVGSYPAMARLSPGGEPVMAFLKGDGSGAILFGRVFSFLGPFAPGGPTGDFARTTPALTFHNGTLHMAYIDAQRKLWHSVFDVSPFGQRWSRKPIEGQSSWGSPALASFNGRLHMVHPGESSNNIWHSVFDGDHWSPNCPIPNQASKTPPALTVFNGILHMVHTGDSSNQLWHSHFVDS